MTYKEIKKMIDKGYELDQLIKESQEELNQIKENLKKFAKTKNREKFSGYDHHCLVYEKPFGTVPYPAKVFRQCKGDKKLFFSLVKVLVTKLEDTFDEKVIKKLVEYKPVTCISFKE